MGFFRKYLNIFFFFSLVFERHDIRIHPKQWLLAGSSQLISIVKPNIMKTQSSFLSSFIFESKKKVCCTLFALFFFVLLEKHEKKTCATSPKLDSRHGWLWLLSTNFACFFFSFCWWSSSLSSSSSRMK